MLRSVMILSILLYLVSLQSIPETLSSGPSHHHKNVLPGIRVGYIQLLQLGVQHVQIFRACSLVSEHSCMASLLSYIREKVGCEKEASEESRNGKLFLFFGSIRYVWYDSGLAQLSASMQVADTLLHHLNQILTYETMLALVFERLFGKVYVWIWTQQTKSAFLFYLKMSCGVSSGAGRCADSSQAFSLY